MTKIQVPQAMLEAAMENCLHIRGCEDGVGEQIVIHALQGALQDLSQHPIVPTDEQLLEISRNQTSFREGYATHSLTANIIEVWLRRMFLAEPEIPEVPDELMGDIIGLFDGVQRREIAPSNAARQVYGKIEAFRRGRSKG